MNQQNNPITNLTETKYTHISGTDNLPVCVLRIEPENPSDVRGIVQLIHGKNEHKGRYKAFMRFLASNGYLTIINDHRGHGESVIEPDDRGYFYQGGTAALVEDLHEITLDVKKYAAEKCGRDDLPLTLLGHSMGSLAARCYIRQYDADISKLCLTGSPSRSDKIRQGLQVIKLLKKLEGKRARSLLAKKLIMGVSYERKYRHEGLKNAWTNSEREAVIEHNNDPLCRFNFTLNGYEEMLKMAMLAYTGDYIPQNPDMPVRFFSGEDDPCALSRQKFVEAMRLMKSIGYSDVRCLLYKGMRHDILHEKNKMRVYRDILRFLESDSKKASPASNNGQTDQSK